MRGRGSVAGERWIALQDRFRAQPLLAAPRSIGYRGRQRRCLVRVDRMARSRSFWFKLLLVSLAAVAVALGILAGWRPALERWHVARLASKEQPERLAAIARLAEIGGERAAEELLVAVDTLSAELDDRDQERREAARRELEAVFAALARIAPRCRASTSREIARSLCDAYEATLRYSPEARSALVELGRADSRVLPFAGALATDIARRDDVARAAAALILEGGYPSHASIVREILFDLQVDEVGVFADKGKLGELLRSGHPLPTVRLSMLERMAWFASRELNVRPFVASFRQDPSPLVRLAALRLLGVLGGREGTAVLTKALLDENDTELLREVIEARTVAANERRPLVRVRLPGGRELGDFSPGELGERQPWQDVEIRRLAEILASRRDPALRDAASRALALARADEEQLDREHSSVRSSPAAGTPAFALHEWGVFIDHAGRLARPDAVLADLPSFVHRSRTSWEALLDGRRLEDGMPTAKTVLYFHTSAPLSVRFRVRFHDGRPWAFFPEVTDYLTHDGDGVSWLDATRNARSDGVLGPSAADLPAPRPISTATGFRPPWIPVHPGLEREARRNEASDLARRKHALRVRTRNPRARRGRV